VNAARSERPMTPPCIALSATTQDSSITESKRPEVKITVFNKISVPALFDSGASVSAISEEFFKRVQTHCPSSMTLSILPVTGITISTAVLGRNRKVTTQVLLPFDIMEKETDAIFLVVPRLATSVILGDDWLSQNGVLLNYMTRQVEFPRWGKSYPFQIDEGVEPASQMMKLLEHHHVESALLTPSEQCTLSITLTAKFIGEENTTIYNLNGLDAQLYPNDPRDDRFDECISSSPGVTEQQRSQLVDVLEKFQSIFDTRPGLNKLYTCRFDVSEDIPFKVRPYPIPFARRPAVESELKRMLTWGVIERCSSPYSNPILCVAKSDGTVRLCLDARRINRVILPMRDSSPPLDELLARFGGKSLFSSLDFTAGYWQVQLHSDVRKFTAFTYDGRTYQFCVVPFGLNISNTAFGLALEAVLNIRVNDMDDQLSDLHIYVDDLLISSTNFSEHLAGLTMMFQKIKMSGMTLKLSKCEFLRQEIKFLGHVITPSGMSMNPSKLCAIHEFPVPRNKKELQSFIGFCNFYRKFADHHASKISPLIELIKTGTPWRFGSAELEMFNSVKKSFTDQYLSHPMFDSEFYLQTDASKLGCGAELFQYSSTGERRTISFASRTLNSAEKNYSITELELLSVVFACVKFRVFILGYKVNVLTDHQALTFLFKCRLRNARLTRWTLLLQEFNLKIQHIPGATNIMDALSRNPVGRDQHDTDESTTVCVSSIEINAISPKFQRHFESFDSILLSQCDDPKLSKIAQVLATPSAVSPQMLKYYLLFKNIVFYRRHSSSDQWLVCIPEHRIDELIIKVHQHFGHVGPKKCILAIREFCFFSSFQTRIRNVVQTCQLCQRAKISNTRVAGEMRSVLADVPLGRVLVDLYGPLPPGWNNVRFIFVVLDNFTRYVRLYPLKKSTAVAVTNRMVNDYIPTYGTPRCIVSDHGVQFTSRVWQARLSAVGVPPTMTSVYHPQSNPAERVMRELGRMFRTYCSEQHMQWPRYVTYIEWVLNNTVHEATGHTPQELFLKVERCNPFDTAVEFPLRVPLAQQTKWIMAREVQISKSERRRQRHDSKGKPTFFCVGQLVLVRVHRLSSAVDKCIQKFYMLYEGPFEVAERKSGNAYVVVDPVTQSIRGTFNVVLLRRYKPAVWEPVQQAEDVPKPKRPG